MVLATPQAWIDVARIDDFDDVCAQFRRRHGRPLRIATKYHRLVREFLRDNGVAVGVVVSMALFARPSSREGVATMK